MKIAFFDTKKYDENIFNEINKSYDFEIDYFETRLSKETAKLAKGYKVICGFVNDDFSKEVINELYENGTEFIALRSAGYNNVNLEETFGKVHVARVPNYSPYSVAEHTLALILSMNRKVHKAFYRTRDNNFNINGLMGFDLHGKTMGVIGTGKIGKTLIKTLKGFEMEVLAYDKYPDKNYKDCTYVSLDELYEKADIISLNCPLNKETYHMIDEDAISKMKDSVMIVNTGRGKLINTQDLIEALKEGKVGSAALDVYEEEAEYFFEDFSNEVIGDDMLSRLLTFPNVLITSHQAFFTKEAVTDIATITLENIKEYAQNETCKNEICYKCNKATCTKKEKGKCF